jgi:predicted amidohydrolase
MIRIAVVQQDHNPGKPEENRNKALAAASKALAAGAEIILFHEELLLGYTPQLKELSEPLNGTTTQAFQNLLQGSQSLIVYGLTERKGDHYYISAPVVSAEGVLACYRKTHLWWKASGLRHEPTQITPGEELVSYKVKDHLVGIMICYDGDFPEMTRSYAILGCSVVLWLNNRSSRGYEEVRDLASRNSMIIAAACCCGLDETNTFCRGGSNITDANGELLVEVWDKEGIITADVDPDKALELREQNPWFRGRRPELYL